MTRTWLVAVCSILAWVAVVRAEPLVVITDERAAECIQYAPAFSFDGEHLAWVERREPNGDSYIQVMEIGSGTTRRVPEEGRAEDFCWAPDRNVLAYVEECWPGDDQTAKLATFDLDLRMALEMPLDALGAHHLIWTPRGIQFVLVGGTPGPGEICYLARAAPETGRTDSLTGPVVNLNLGRGGSDSVFAWSPEGKSAAVLDASQVPFLHVWEEAMPEFAPAKALAALNLRPADTHCLAVGPEGKEIFFAAFRARQQGSMAVWRYRPAEGVAGPILRFPDDHERPICLAVSQAGDRLAVVSARADARDWSRAVAVLHVASLTEEPEWGERKLEVAEGFLGPGGSPERHLAIRWSRDGERLAYSLDGQVRLARVGTQTFACEFGLKQTGLAFLMFASDFDGALPGPTQVAELKRISPAFTPVEGPDWWTALIGPYVGQEADVMRCPLMGEGEGTGHIYPEHLWGKMVGDTRNPSKTILLMDSAPRHDGKRVVAFADGHVEVVAEENIPALVGGK